MIKIWRQINSKVVEYAVDAKLLRAEKINLAEQICSLINAYAGQIYGK